MRKRLPSYVSWIGADYVEVEARTNADAEKFKHLGFVFAGRGRQRGTMQKEASGEAEKARTLQMLADLGLPFSAGRDWCPIAVAEELRDRGLLKGPLKMIGWFGPGQWQVKEV
ncbi:MAG: hypothetical protein SVV80_08960 [Planctomycetota bacterium]|nr:hypothetical protein [Planctomycetota bacterium]